MHVCIHTHTTFLLPIKKVIQKSSLLVGFRFPNENCKNKRTNWIDRRKFDIKEGAAWEQEDVEDQTLMSGKVGDTWTWTKDNIRWASSLVYCFNMLQQKLKFQDIDREEEISTEAIIGFLILTTL